MKMEDMALSGPDNTRLEALVHDIYSELVEDACLGLCFEVHRAVKHGYFFLDDTDPESAKEFEIVDQPGLDIFGQVYNQWKNKECECPNCKRLIAASRFAPHLEKCLGMGRNSSRIASRRLASNNNNVSKSESDQEDNDDLNDNDWSYGAEKKSKKRKSDKNQNSPRRSKSLKHKNGDLNSSVTSEAFKYNNYNNAGISYETLGPEEVRSLLTTQCGVISEHTKKMCTRSQRCPQHTDEQRRSVRVFLLGPSASSLPDADASVEGDMFELQGDGSGAQSLISRLQWEDSPEISPTDSASSRASTNHSDPRRPKKKKRTSLVLNSTAVGGGGGGVSGEGTSGSLTSGSNGGVSQSNVGLPAKKKRPKLPAPSISSIFDDLN
ncbi:ataxin-7-like protein 3 isoform X1 [Hippocampus zosterae]|uniref:ataxin-7-like protein 3 isoform X1 n=1 Tax=Hippocampus zosterae TaxID=109293 RepID=UPI00223D3905|nr:ataxin-7-like protein 3 isoform X1 [Hippocampus zosterae]XP_051905444.1 ataxin-7-like protein 3 isoform X1 [Hippocampus zosterae]XP_051905445.1 ataxin-7-like protein 3 isoform X1 [Hippocampus zosterae]XP_051905446.1 ataxin-7-like protein 3 isoform X1 [Hippocampus zosterae]XP_051905447.1 ataxin-7-like protein 3 isoform X1 [Hippocampus zosterae]